MSELPKGWELSPIKDLFDFKYGKGMPKEQRNPSGNICVYGSNGVVGHHDESVTKGPTIIVGRKGSVGEVHLSLQPCWPIDTTYFIDEFFGEIPPEYWAYFLKSLNLGKKEKSSAIPGISRDDIYKNVVLVPPLAEQRRIGAKLEMILGKVDCCRKRLEIIPGILKRFRLSVLAAACSGQLTAEWREATSDVEPASLLLSRIRAARTAAAQTTREKRQIEEAFADKQLAVSDDEIPFDELPDSWATCRVGAVGTVLNGSTPSRRHSEYWAGDIAWVSSGEVRNNIITDTRERITPLGYESSSVRLLPAGTVLLAMIGEGKTRGQTAILKIEATINQNIAAVLLTHGLLVPEFLWRWLQFQYEATRERGGGSGPQALNCQRVRELPLVLPPLSEQRRIVRCLEALFALAERIESHLRAASVRAERLPQAILVRAFRGELVPTEAELAAKDGRDYEMASLLLERIQEARQKNKLAKHGRGGKKMATRNTGRRPSRTRRPLDEVLREQGQPLTPEQLFDLAGFNEDTVDAFYEQLRMLIHDGRIREDRPNKKDVYLEAVGE